MQIQACAADGRRLSSEIAFMVRGIGKAKVVYPSPGWRGWFFQFGNGYRVTHFTIKADTDHDVEWTRANNARQEHEARTAKSLGTNKAHPAHKRNAKRRSGDR